MYLILSSRSKGLKSSSTWRSSLILFITFRKTWHTQILNLNPLFVQTSSLETKSTLGQPFNISRHEKRHSNFAQSITTLARRVLTPSNPRTSSTLTQRWHIPNRQLTFLTNTLYPLCTILDPFHIKHRHFCNTHSHPRSRISPFLQNQ